MTGRKTDNHDPTAKLDLRRHFLRKYHADNPPRVIDCCQGGGLLWNTLRQEFDVASYWPLDLKPKKGRLRLDSVRVLEQPGWNQDLIDCDTYGSPWGHWVALLPNVQLPATVFLTIGNQNLTATSPNAHGANHFFNFPKSTPPTLAGIVSRANDVKHGLSIAYKYGVKIVEAVEATASGNARYIGVRLEKSPKKPSP